MVVAVVNNTKLKKCVLTKSCCRKVEMKRIKYNSPVVLTFAIISLLALGLSSLSDGGSNRLMFSVYGNNWGSPMHYFRLLAHSLGHANVQHLSGNILLMLLVGPSVEERYGSLRLLCMMLGTSLVIGLISVLVQPTIMLLGASGIVFMLIILNSFGSSDRGMIPVTLILVVIVYMGQEVFVGVQNILGTTEDSISQLAHIVGGLCGLLFGFIFRSDRKNEE